jgi:nucleotide-binding universal stress UspA family protein
MKRKSYRHLLVPTDGSALALRGARAAVSLARDLGARLRAVYVAPKDEPLGAVHGASILLEHFEQATGARAKKALGAVKAAADAAGVRCVGEAVTDNEPWKGMLRVARARKCDLVVIASKGRFGGWMLRGETARLLSGATIAVLVVR